MSIRKSTAMACAIASVVAFASGCGEESDPDNGIMPPLNIAAVAKGTTKSQAPALADGRVTFAEYEEATLKAIECLKAAGLTVEGPHPRNGDDTRFLDFSYGTDSATGAVETTRDRTVLTGDACEAEHYRDVARVWEFQHLLTPEERSRQRPLVVDCLRRAGLDIADDASHREVFEAVSERRDGSTVECMNEYPDYFVAGVE